MAELMAEGNLNKTAAVVRIECNACEGSLNSADGADGGEID